MSNYNAKDFGKVKIEVAAETVKTFDDLNSNSETEESEFRDTNKDYKQK